MAASGGTILKEYADEIEKITARHEHALGYAPGMDELEMQDWAKLRDFLGAMKHTYNDMAKKYSWQVGLTAEDLREISSACYEERDKGPTLHFNFYECRKQKSHEFREKKNR